MGLAFADCYIDAKAIQLPNTNNVTMSDNNTAATDRVPLIQKAAFGSGHLVNNLMPGALGVFMFFLLTAFGMDPFLAGLLGGLPRIVDALQRRNCRLLEAGEELYDIVDDLGYFIPDYVPDETVEERQEALREHAAQDCAALALAD